MAYDGVLPLSVKTGGTGDAQFTPYAVVTGGTSPTGALQSVAGIGASGQVLTSNGVGLPTWQAASLSTVIQITAVTHAMSPYTVTGSDQFLAVDATAGVVTILLPNSPTTGRVIFVKDSKGQAAINNITVTTVGGAVTIDGVTSLLINNPYIARDFVYDGAAYELS